MAVLAAAAAAFAAAVCCIANFSNDATYLSLPTSSTDGNCCVDDATNVPLGFISRLLGPTARLLEALLLAKAFVALGVLPVRPMRCENVLAATLAAPVG